jgi:sulfate transport system substrate-binding protein
MKLDSLKYILILLVLGFSEIGLAEKKLTLLNVSYDPTREFYQEFNTAFAKHWKEKAGETLTIHQSHGGSSKQARSVIDGLGADVVTLALAYDVDAIADQTQSIPKNWQTRLPNNSAPYTSTIVFLVRKGNPKNIRDWEDLIKPGIEIITPNPKTSGGARWNYLAAWAYALKKWNHDENKAQEFVAAIYKNVPVLDSGARGSTTTFVERQIGDVLIAWENEAFLSIHELNQHSFELVIPSVSVLAEPSVSWVDKNTQTHGTRALAEAYLNYLYSEEGQEIAARHYYRPRLEKVAQKYAHQFKTLELVTIDQLGTWKKAQQKHFSNGGVFDQIYEHLHG